MLGSSTVADVSSQQCNEFLRNGDGKTGHAMFIETPLSQHTFGCHRQRMGLGKGLGASQSPPLREGRRSVEGGSQRTAVGAPA